MTDYATIEALAKRLCADAGRDWNAKYTKRAHWRKKALASMPKTVSIADLLRMTWAVVGRGK